MLKVSDTTLAYIAGIIDGEAYVGVKKTTAYKCQGRKTPGYHARVQICMVHESAIRFLAETLGGWYYPEKKPKEKRRRLYCYQSSDMAAAEILEAVLPFLRIKRESAENVLKLRALQSDSAKHRTKITGYRNFPNKYGVARKVANKSFSDEYVAMCDAIYRRCKALNH